MSDEPKYLWVLFKCQPNYNTAPLRGLSTNFAQQAGYLRSVNLLIRRGLAKLNGGRVVTTLKGERLLKKSDMWLSPRAGRRFRKDPFARRAVEYVIQP